VRRVLRAPPGSRRRPLAGALSRGGRRDCATAGRVGRWRRGDEDAAKVGEFYEPARRDDGASRRRMKDDRAAMPLLVWRVRVPYRVGGGQAFHMNGGVSWLRPRWGPGRGACRGRGEPLLGGAGLRRGVASACGLSSFGPAFACVFTPLYPASPLARCLGHEEDAPLVCPLPTDEQGHQRCPRESAGSRE